MGQIKWLLIGCLVFVWGRAALAQGIDSIPVGDHVSNTITTELVIISFKEPHSIDAGKILRLDSLALAQAITGNVGDLLRTLPSVSAKRYSPGGLSTPSFRGTGAGHTQVFWEGLPLNSPMLGQQDFSLSAGGVIDQLSVYYGGSSLVFGSGGLGGALNLSSNRKPVFPFAFRLHQQVGSWQNVSTSADIDGAIGNLQFGTQVYVNGGRNQFPFHNTSLPNAPVERLQNASTLQYGGMQSLKFQMHHWALSAQIWMLQADRALPPTMLTTNSVESQQDHSLRALLGASHFSQFGHLRLQGGYFREGMTYQNPVAQLYSPASFTRGIADAYWSYTYFPHRVKLVEAGLRYLYDQASSDGLSQSATLSQVSAMAHGSYAIHPQQTIELLLRQELNQMQLSPILGMLGGKFAMPIEGMQLRASVARNYRFPTINDRYWVPGGNPDLQPELSHSTEMHLHYDARPQHKNLLAATISLGGYFNHVNDWILWVPGTSAIWHPENVQTVNATGLETNGELLLRLGGTSLQADAHYTWSSTRDQSGHQLIYTPQHNAFGRLMVRHGAWDLQYAQDWNSRRFTVADNSLWLQGFTTADLSIGWDAPIFNQLQMAKSRKGIDHETQIFLWNSIAAANRIHLQAGMRNIANAQYQTVAWRPMPGRSVFLRLDFTFSGGNPI